jgi:PIN domain nuclease of toxin-antitoxin system
MRLLLDTHVLIWWLAGDKNILPRVRDQIAHPDNEIFISIASAWEIAIKKTSGRLKAPDDLAEQIERHAFTPLPITLHHALQAGALPLHHRDPFDRMLIAQAMCEELTIVTRDVRIAEYDVEICDA